MPQRGKYIVLEGGEGCGKSTQVQLLVEYLNDKHVLSFLCREPGTAKVGEQIRGILLDKGNDISPEAELFLFEAARAEFFKKDLMPKLEEGITVVVDRSCYSTLAYQGYAGGIDLDLINRLNKAATFGIRPDLAVVIDIDAWRGLEKEKNPDRFAAKGPEYHEKVNFGFREVAKQNIDNTIIIPYRKMEEIELYSEIREEVDKLF